MDSFGLTYNLREDLNLPLSYRIYPVFLLASKQLPIYERQKYRMRDDNRIRRELKQLEEMRRRELTISQIVLDISVSSAGIHDTVTSSPSSWRDLPQLIGGWLRLWMRSGFHTGNLPRGLEDPRSWGRGLFCLLEAWETITISRVIVKTIYYLDKKEGIKVLGY